MIKAIIFDVDGVLIDNTDIIVKIFQETARRAGVRIPGRQRVLQFLGLTGFEMVDKILGKNPQYKKIYYQVWKEKEIAMPLAAGSAAALKKLKIKKAIATSRRSAGLKESLKNIYPYFSAAIGRDDVINHKPNPEPIFKACQQLGISPKEAVYIGDAAVDVKAARQAKINFIGLLSGGTTRAQFKKMKVEYIIKSLGELPALIEKL